MLKRYSSVLIVILGLLLIGCGTAPVYQVTDTPIVTATDNYTLDSVRQAIFRAGTTKGWQMSNVSNRRIDGSITVRKATAQVTIDFNRTRYSIRYKGSSNLDYDGTNIRDGYNRWIRNLDQQIKIELSGL
ncbi:MAG: hypothetical protein R3F53_19765 [Gammaproteobacteria bacterium]